MTIAEFVSIGTVRLARTSESPALDAQMLAAHVLRVERSWVLAHPQDELPELAMEVLLQRRESGEPLAYILGWREFYGRKFSVRPGVLIPRQDTEIVVEACLQMPSISTVLDVGTGSGIIAATLALERPDWSVWACDISPEALQVAQENALSLNAQVSFAISDLFCVYEGMQFDLIVSNPPYIGANESLPREVRSFEPHQALFSGETGDEIYGRLAIEAPRFLAHEGRLVLELGFQSRAAVTNLLEHAGWRIDQIVKDLSGIDRCLVASIP